MRPSLLGLVAGCVVCLLGGCGSRKAGPAAAGKKQLLLFCGAGIRPPVDELVEAFGGEHGAEVAVDYAGSEVLLSKIKISRRGDLYMPGERHYVEQAAREGLIGARAVVGYFVPTILVQKGNPRKITGLADLVKPGVKLGLGDERACAVGRQSKEIFAKNGIAWAEVERNLKFKSVTVNELGMQIQARSLDAVIVWDAIAEYYAKHGDQVPLPAAQNIISTVEVGVLTFTRERELAEKFLAFAASERGQGIFKKHKYRVTPPE